MTKTYTFPQVTRIKDASRKPGLGYTEKSCLEKQNKKIFFSTLDFLSPEKFIYDTVCINLGNMYISQTHTDNKL